MNKIVLMLLFLILIVCFFYFDWQQFLTLEYLQQQHQRLAGYYQHHQLITVTVFFLAYVLMTALSLPGGIVFTLAAGAVFGLFWGTVIVSFASAIGATCACFLSRYFIGRRVQRRYGEKLRHINAGLENQGAYYLFSLRLVPLFPFFIINLLMGLTQIPLWTFYWVTQVGLLAGTAVYVNAGTQLAQIENAADIVSLPLLMSFVLLGIFPLIGKKFSQWLKARTQTPSL